MNQLSLSPMLLLGQAGGGSNAALFTFLLYTLAVFALAWASNRLLQSKSFLSEYFLGSRSLGMWAFALTFAATSSSGGSFTGFPAKIYTYGWVLALWIASYMVVPICAMGLLGKRINQVARISGAITVPDVIRDRFQSARFGLLATLLIVFFMTINLVAQFKAGTLILMTLLKNVDLYAYASARAADAMGHVGFLEGVGPDYLVCLFTFGVAVIVYTAYGGFHAVVWTDVMQGVVMVVGVIIMLPLAISQAGGLGAVTTQMEEMTPPRLGTIVLRLDAPAGEERRIEAGTWLSMSRTDYQRAFDAWLPGELKRLERARDKQELSPEQYDAALKNLASRPKRLEEGPDQRLFRVVKSSVIKAGRTTVEKTVKKSGKLVLVDSPVDVVELTTPAEIDAQLARLDAKTDLDLAANPELLNLDMRVESPALRDYLFGGGEKGHYITGPGPHDRKMDGFLPLSLAISFFFMWAISGAGQPSSMVRLMAFNNAKTLRRSIFTVAVYYSMIYFPLVIIFCCARVLLPGMEGQPDQIMPAMAIYLTENIGQGWLAGLLVAAPFAAVMSTVDSFLLMISSALVRDIYQRNINPEVTEKVIKRLSYLCTLLIGIAVMLGAVNPPQFLQDIIVYCGSGLAACFLAPMVFALYWPRVNAAMGITKAMRPPERK